jgi:hypothetical protein
MGSFYTIIFTIVVVWAGWQLWLMLDSIGRDDDETETRD